MMIALSLSLSLSLSRSSDEVRAKSRALERTKMKLRSAEEDVSDLQTEFELERQGYLDTIRNQVCNKYLL